MKSVVVTHSDIRDLLLRLGARNPHRMAWDVGERHVAGCFGLTLPALERRMTDAQPLANEIRLDEETFRRLVEKALTEDLAGLKNTRRLQIVAEAFGWNRADAFMHQLKTTTQDTSSALAATHPDDPTLFNCGIHQADAWANAVESATTGLFVFAGMPGSRKLATMSLTLEHLLRDGKGVVPGKGGQVGRVARRRRSRRRRGRYRRNFRASDG